MKEYEDMNKEELLQEIDRLKKIISKQDIQIMKLEDTINSRKKPGRKPIISAETRFKAYMLHAQGKSYRKISKELDISLGTISSIIKKGGSQND